MTIPGPGDRPDHSQHQPRSVLAVTCTVELGSFSLALDLVVQPGQVIGVTGGIGSGKSTALAVIAGRQPVTTGVIRYGDQTWDDPRTGTFVADRPVTLLPQKFNSLPEHLTGVQAVTAAISRFQPNHPNPEIMARATLAEIGLGDHVVDRLPETFSGAEAQRIGLAAAVAPRPPVILLDEPFGAMDKRTGATVRQWLENQLSEYDGVAVIASTRADDLIQLTDRVINLDLDLQAARDPDG